MARPSHTAASLNDVSPAVNLGGSQVYLQNTSGGSTKAVHTGGRDVDLYNVSNQTTRLTEQAPQALDTSTTSITFADTAILSSMSAGSSNFILMGNELMEITQIDTGLGVTVNRAAEGTDAATHADGSVIPHVTKTAAATTLRGDVDTAVNDVPVFSVSNFDAQDIIKVENEFFRVTVVNSNLVGQATVTFSQPKSIAALNGQSFEIRLNYSHRLTVMTSYLSAQVARHKQTGLMRHYKRQVKITKFMRTSQVVFITFLLTKMVTSVLVNSSELSRQQYCNT